MIMAQSREDKDTVGPVILWKNYGCEGWKPYSFPSVHEALLQPHYEDFIITRPVHISADCGEIKP